VSCAVFARRGLVWPLEDERVLGTTPLVQVPLEMGSYLLTIRSPGKRDTLYPVRIAREQHWTSGDAPVTLHTDDEIGAGFVYVPAGPFQQGGDPEAPGGLPRTIARTDAFFAAVLPVTMLEYCAFINALHVRDPEEAWARVPRAESGLKDGRGQYWERPAPGHPYVLPEVDRDGDRWDPRFPAFGLSWHDAAAYAEWRSARDGRPLRLPTELEWEKAARGVDGRAYPWGDRFDAAACKMSLSRPGRPQPEPVGAFPTDVSVYGIRDLAGGVRQWCGESAFDGDPQRRPVRGGAWQYDARAARIAGRQGGEAWTVLTTYGLRLACSPPARGR
jgi:serine/threonine-protein kinase